MSYDIHLKIPEDSHRGHLIALLTLEQHITPSQAVERLIDLAAKTRFPNGEETPGELIERLRAQKAVRGSGSRAPSGKGNPESIIGLFAGDETFGKAIEEIISHRAQRYGFSE